MLVQFFRHDKADRARARHLDNGPVDPAYMIAQHQYTSGLGDVFHADDIQAVAPPDNHADEEADHGLGQFIQGVDSAGQGNQQQYIKNNHAVHASHGQYHG